MQLPTTETAASSASDEGGHLTYAATVSSDGLERIFARRGRSAFLGILTFFAVFVLTAGLSNLDNVLVIRVSGPGLFLIGCMSIWRVFRSGIYIDRDTLVVRSMFRVKRVDPTQISRFDPPKPYPTYWGNGIRIVLRSGETVSTGVFGATPLDPNPGVPQTAELNAWVAEASHGGVIPQRRTIASRKFVDQSRGPLGRAVMCVLCLAVAFDLVLAVVAVANPKGLIS